MGGVLIGFVVILSVVAAGYVIGRTGILGEHAPAVLARLVFFVLSPCLLFVVLAEAEIQLLFSSVLIVSGLAAFAAFALFMLVASLVWRRPLTEMVIGALASSYVNSNNIGIPVAAYVLGDAAFSAPVLLLQLLVITPIALTMLEAHEHGRPSVGRILLGPVKNPIIIGSALGAVVAVTGVQLPDWMMDPFRMVGAAAVPGVLLAFGMSLHGQRPLHPGTDRGGVLLATTIKLVIMPVIAWLLGHVVFGLEGHVLFVIVVLAALPSAQLVFNYAQRYDRDVILARDIVLLTTAGCIPVLVLVATFFAA